MPASSPAARSGLARVRALSSLVRFSHTLFALPWALSGLLLGSGGWPKGSVLGKVLLAMVAARTAAMVFNRLVDRRLDATNPRTAARPSVTGEVSVAAMGTLLVVSLMVFVATAFWLNPLCGWLSLPTVGVLLGYSLCKRFTSLAHLALGLALGISPLGACLAAAPVFDQRAGACALFGLAVLLWTAGFDVIYACQDVEHDRKEGLHSLPARLGIAGALRLSAWLHVPVPLLVAAGGWIAEGGWVLSSAAVLVAGVLAYEHRLVRPDDLRRVGAAFFQANVAISVLVLLATVLAFGLGVGR